MNRFFPELTERPRVRPVSVEEIREVNFLPFFYRPGVWLLSISWRSFSGDQHEPGVAGVRALSEPQPAGATDPVFNRDVGFYLFRLPVLELLNPGGFRRSPCSCSSIIAAIRGYMWYLERMRGTVTTNTKRRATAAISAAGAIAAARLRGKHLFGSLRSALQSRTSLFTGISYTDANVRLLAMNILIGLLSALGRRACGQRFLISGACKIDLLARVPSLASCG